MSDEVKSNIPKQVLDQAIDQTAEGAAEVKPKDKAKPEKGESPDRATGKDKRQGTDKAPTRESKDTSQFQRDTRHMTAARVPKQLGHKISTQQRPAQPEKPVQPEKPLQQQKGALSRQELRAFRHLVREMPKKPSAEAYRLVTQHRAFRGPLKGTPLQQKFLRQAVRQQVAQAQRGFDTGAPLNKGELMQMFRMRNRSAQKDRFRQVLRYELAKTRQQAAKKVQSIRYKTDSQQKQKDITKNQQAQLNKLDISKQQIANRIKSSSAPSQFEQTLQKVMSGNKAVPDLPEGIRARFATKSDAEWSTFFKNAATQGSALAKTQGKLTSMIESLFRGLFNKGKQTMLVADLALSLKGEVAENKFSQIELTDQKLMDAMKKLTPGDTLSQDLLKRLGEEFNFLKLAHMPQVDVLTEEQRKEMLKSLRQSHSPEAQKKIEMALLSHRDSTQEERELNKQPFEYAGTMFDKKRRFPGKQKLFMYILYGIVGFTAIMIVFLLLRAMM